jgi:hypothetical protein
MTRSRATAKKAGTEMETAVADYLAANVDDRIERRRLSGPKDKGDISGLRVHGKRVVVEVKNTMVAAVKPHLDEAEDERQNDGALVGLVVQKRRGIGITTADGVGQQLVMLTLRDLAALITGERP